MRLIAFPARLLALMFGSLILSSCDDVRRIDDRYTVLVELDSMSHQLVDVQGQNDVSPLLALYETPSDLWGVTVDVILETESFGSDCKIFTIDRETNVLTYSEEATASYESAVDRHARDGFPVIFATTNLPCSFDS